MTSTRIGQRSLEIDQVPASRDPPLPWTSSPETSAVEFVSVQLARIVDVADPD